MEIEKKEELSSSNPVYSEDDVAKVLEGGRAEIEAKVKEALKEEIESEFITEKEKLLIEKEEKEVELDKMKEEIEGLKDKDRNFENLRKKVVGADKIEK